jgi:hypothetical protein
MNEEPVLAAVRVSLYPKLFRGQKREVVSVGLSYWAKGDEGGRFFEKCLS